MKRTRWIFTTPLAGYGGFVRDFKIERLSEEKVRRFLDMDGGVTKSTRLRTVL